MPAVDRSAEFRHLASNVRDSRVVAGNASLQQLSPFEQAARLIFQGIQRVRRLLNDEQWRYLGLHRSHTCDSAMTAQERDSFEKAVVRFMKSCAAELKDLKLAVQDGPNASPDLRRHQELVVDILSAAFNQVSKRFQELQSELVQNAKSSTRAAARNLNHSRTAMNPALFETALPGSSSSSEEWKLSAEEQAQLQEENLELVKDLEDNLEAIRKAEMKTVEISQLMEQFCMKVMEQHEIVERVYDEAIAATTNIEQGYSHLTSAVERSVSSRFFIFGVIVMAAFALLFLDRLYS